MADVARALTHKTDICQSHITRFLARIRTNQPASNTRNHKSYRSIKQQSLNLPEEKWHP